ncbi:LytTR family transcriptional regulator [Clostridiaceae bacterium]|nr:LytTR family transcriptional regulator [Clostridiaceae bacterium]RKI17368.1 LytTR family transcriptional regulator [bacterium 1XD21-70]
MVSMMVYDPHTEELELMKTLIRKAAAVLTEEKWQMDFFARREQVAQFLKDRPLLDMLCYDVSPKGSIEDLERIREIYQNALLLLIADAAMSPMEYIRPTILASSLLLRPVSPGQAQDQITDLVERFVNQTSDGKEESLVIEAREGKTYVPLSQIYYFEAREKRIYVRLKKKELAFYETMENLEQRLPEQFVRCHRSFIVSKKRIRKVMLSKNLIELEQGMEIPLSRSYKSAFKEQK